MVVKANLAKYEQRERNRIVLNFDDLFSQNFQLFISHTWHDSALIVSSSNKQDTADELKRLKAHQERVNLLLERFSRKPPDASDNIAHCYDSVQITNCPSWVALTEALRRLAKTSKRIANGIVVLRRRLKAIKRAMRQRQRMVFCGIEEVKKVWFLLHGSHPPKGIPALIAPFTGVARI